MIWVHTPLFVKVLDARRTGREGGMVRAGERVSILWFRDLREEAFCSTAPRTTGSRLTAVQGSRKPLL